MRLYLLAFLIFVLSYFQITKHLQLSFFNFFSPGILILKGLSMDIKDVSVILSNLDGIREENSRLKEMISNYEDKKNKLTITNLNKTEVEELEMEFKDSQILRNKKISIKKIIYYDSFQSKLILENSNQEKIENNSLVLIGDNLIGLVKNSNDSSIEVSLISSEELLLNTHILNSKTFKIKTVLDSESGDSLVINNILTTEEVDVGDIVLTSNNNEGIVPDLIIGNIQRIEGISSQTFRKAYLLKNYDLSTKNYVGIMKNE